MYQNNEKAAHEDSKHSGRSSLQAQIISLFSKNDCFSSIPPSLQIKIAEGFSPRHFNAGQVIYLEGEPAEFVYLIKKGWVKATRMSADGREQTLLAMREGEMFGEVAVFTEKIYPNTVIALEPVELFSMPAKTLIKLTSQYLPLSTAMVQHLSKRILYYIGLVEDMALRNVKARVASTLLRNAELRGDTLVVPRRSWTTFDEMAVRLGTVRDVLSRTLHSLEKEKLLLVKRNEIIILDPVELKKRSNS